jgi:hypothetical protein
MEYLDHFGHDAITDSNNSAVTTASFSELWA